MDFRSTNSKIVLNYEMKGSGRALLLLHGNGEDHTIFDVLIEKLKNKFTVYAIDSRNHGKSTKTDDYSYDIMSDDILQFITNLKLNKPIVIGFSDGAIISLILTLKNPSLLSKMVLLGVNLKPTDFKDENYNYLLHEYEKSKDPLIKLMLDQPNIELDSLKDIKIPTLVVAAENDLFKDELYFNIAEIIPDVKLEIMREHNHDSYIVDTDILYPILIDFL